MREDLQRLIEQMRQGGILYDEAVSVFRKAFITSVLRENGGNICKAAAALKLHRNTLARMCSELEVNPKALRPARRHPPTSVRPSAQATRSAR